MWTGAPGDHGCTNAGICFKQHGPAQPLVKHFLEYGRLDNGMIQYLPPLLVFCGVRGVRYGEQKVGTKSRVKLGAALPYVSLCCPLCGIPRSATCTSIA